MKMNRNKRVRHLGDHKNRHHIIPSSRGGKGHKQNIVIVDIEQHKDYHKLFRNLTPDEIIKYLVDYFWNGETKWVKIYLNEEENNE